MWIDESDTTQLSQRLRVGPRELLESIGGPWQVSERIPEREMESSGTLFVGRAGPSVAILVSDDPDPDVRIGVAVGQWQGAWPLLWSLTDETALLRTPPRDALSAEVDAFLADLQRAVDAAAALKARALVVCRYCGALVAPEHAVGEELCQACGANVFGIVY